MNVYKSVREVSTHTSVKYDVNKVVGGGGGGAGGRGAGGRL